MAHSEMQNQQAGVKSRSIFRRIQKPLILLAILNAFILIFVLYVLKVPDQLNKNSFDICQKQVDNRQKFLQEQMTNDWANLGDLARYINSTCEYMAMAGIIDPENLETDAADSSELILSVIDTMIQKLYAARVSGIYMVFNTHDLNSDVKGTAKTGVYIRDKDPLSASSEKYADLLLECCPARVVQEMALSTDRDWEAKFKFDVSRPYEDWLLQPYRMGCTAGELTAEDCGFWSIKDPNSKEASLTYSMPLILPDGRVYGVLGIELLPTYLDVLLPGSELGDGGMYGLFLADPKLGDGLSGKLHFAHYNTASGTYAEEISLMDSKYGGMRMQLRGEEWETALTPLSLYSRNTPFAGQNWYVLGAVPTGKMFAFSRRVTIMLLVISALILMAGLIGAWIASWHISRPIRALQHELSEAKPGSIPQLSSTGIQEVDEFASAITNLSQSVVNSSKRFLSIMEMSSIDMGGFELDEKNDFLFVTDNYFDLFCRPDLKAKEMTPESFVKALSEIREQYKYEQTTAFSKLYTVPEKSGAVRYIHVQERWIEARRIAVAEDVTRQVLERKHLERERDYDLLTGIFNRRAFNARVQKLLENPEKLGVAAAVMLDLDDLKKINDTYGHEWGDRYIVAAAGCIKQFLPDESVYARISGDEFNIFMYGFADHAQIERAIQRLWEGFGQVELQLPDGIVQSVSASGGYVYVQEETQIHQLIKFADFAMYKTKRGRKGGFTLFEQQAYLANEAEKERHSIFRRIVRKERIRYEFQPIVSVKTGRIYGCEALMRILDTENMELAEFLSIARREQALRDVEHLTWFNALTAYRRLIQSGVVGPDVKLFVNSHVNHLLSKEDQEELIRRFGDIRDQVVMEVVETDDLAQDFLKLTHSDYELFAETFALDDYGTGYSSERNLIMLMPGYIKVDMALIRGVEKYRERQKLLQGLVSFAHEKEILVLAEGVETLAELECLLSLGIDLFQGYLFARPAEIPGDLNPEAMAMLLAMAK